ncbi:guanylate kinase [Petrotoga sp. 9PWA.NaAc.5.4]|uniref:guanylate kinase n=1 Tax=Petrotoga sp. 9PWA.NaAc.5.4 TaxID=1434328 RepID=UPI000CCAC3A3|nr:guanylate kinase [Petrotoga sp. 9PWA.NaAc.5.4]PNR92484.1 guanylate kinase [Petrotoga sp. 9PWA.NaAc.5.4]
MTGLLYVVSGPSGAGKSTLIKNALNSLNGFSFSVSYTTRAKREGEIDGKDYFFVSLETFMKMRENNEFLEWAKVHGNYYATSKSFVERSLQECKGVVLDVDVQGALNIKSRYPKATYIFILPPSPKDLEERLKKRGTETEDSIETRLKDAESEISQIDIFDYILVNYEILEATKQLMSVLVTQQLKKENFKERDFNFSFFKKGVMF